MPTFLCEHTFKTSLSPVKFEAVVTKACRAPFDIELTGHDPGMIPAMRLFTIGFYSLEDRDRVRIALRFLENDQPAACPHNPPHARPRWPVRQRLLNHF